MATWSRKLVVLSNIFNQKYLLQHSRTLYYRPQQIIHHIQLIRQTIISYQLENEYSTAIQKTSEILNKDDIHSCVTPRKQNFSVQATSTPPRLTPLITTLPLAPVELPKTTELPPVGK